jgi:hypothetical protein
MIRYIRLIPILVLICTQTNVGNAAGGSPFSCTDESGPISSMSLWLDASDTSSITMSGTRVTYWRDKSGNGRNATAVGDPNYQAGFGANKIIRLDGDDYFKLNLDFLANRSHSAFIVTKSEKGSYLYGAAAGGQGNNSLHVGYISDNSFALNYWGHNCYPNINHGQHTAEGNTLNFVWPQGGNKQIYVNGYMQSITNCPGNPGGIIGAMAGGGRIGGVVGQRYEGEIAEIIMYTRVLSQAEREATEAYLAAKWGLSAPPPVTGMSLWLDASDTSSIDMSGTSVTTWRDKSGNGRNATAVGDPNYQTGFGANKIIRLDGNDYFNLNLDFLANQSHSAFIVTKRENSTNIYGAAAGGQGNRSLHVGYRNGTQYRMNYWGNDCYININTSQHTSGGNILNYVWPQGGNKQIYLNGNSQSSGGCPAGTIGTMAGGGRIGNVVGHGIYQGEIAEIIMYTRVLSVAEREATEEYLAAKWGWPTVLVE